MDIGFTTVKSDNSVDDLDTIPQVGNVLEYIYGGLDHVQPPASLVAGAAVLQGCLPLLMQERPAERLKERIGQKKFEQLRDLYRQSSLLNLWYELELKHVLEVLAEVHIPVMVLKGADIATTIYPHPGLRHFGDVDLMVQPRDLVAITRTLERMGYRYHQEYRFEAISRKRAGFVYVKEVAVGYLIFEIHTALHSNEMGVLFDTAQIWERARSITIADHSVYGMGLEDLFLYLCWHYRSHSFTRLIWLYDIAILLLRCGGRLDWELVQRLARKQGLAATVYYCAHWCREVFHIAVPGDAQLEKFRPPIFIQRLVARQVGEDLILVLRAAAYRERKLLQRLMVDDIPMLCLVMMRAVFPSPTHLGRLYMEHSRLPVRLFWLYYPLHPFFLLREYLRQQNKSSSHRR